MRYVCGLILVLVAVGLGGPRAQAGVQFDGVDDVATHGSLLGSPATVSLAVWMRWTGEGLAGSDVLSIADRVLIRLSSFPYVQCSYGHAGGYENISAAVNVLNTGWHHLVFVANPAGATQTVYIDGAVQATGSASNAITYSGSSTVLATNPTGSSFFFGGEIAAAAVYGTALAADDVAALAQGRLAVSARTQPLAAWDFGACTGGVSVQGVSFADQSGAGRSLTADDGANNTGMTCTSRTLIRQRVGGFQ